MEPGILWNKVGFSILFFLLEKIKLVGNDDNNNDRVNVNEHKRYLLAAIVRSILI